MRIVRSAILITQLLVLTGCGRGPSSGVGSERIVLRAEEMLRSHAVGRTQTPAVVALPTRTMVLASTPSPMHTATPSPEPSWTPTVTATPTATETPSPAPTITPSAGELAIPRLDLVPGDPIPYLETFRLLTYYGSPTGWGLGILGESDRADMTRDLCALALQLQALSPNRFVLPTYHMVSTVADKTPGADENYSHQVSLEILEEWVAAANESNTAAILDIQPARADLQDEFDRIKHLLYHPHVHMALDPEFIVTAGQIPGSHLGQIMPDQINNIQSQLEEIALEVGLNRVLIIHQFEDTMVIDKDLLVDFPHVELVIDSDGVGGKAIKLYDYRQYSQEPGFEYAGIKIFTRHDTAPLLTLDEVMALEPQPAIVVYQ